MTKPRRHRSELDRICASNEDGPERAELRREALSQERPLTWALDRILELMAQARREKETAE